MSDFRPKILISRAKQTTRRSTSPFGLFALFSVAACASENDDPGLVDGASLVDDLNPGAPDSSVADALIYITLDGSLGGANLAQIDISNLVLDGGDGVSPINLGDLDASEVNVVTDSDGNQVFAVARTAANRYASSGTFSVPTSYSLKATSAISFFDREGFSQTIDAGDVISKDALTIDPGLISVLKELADFRGNTTQLAETTVDLGELFTSVSSITFSVVDDKSNTIALSDKNDDGIVAEFSLDELAPSFGESGTITVRAELAGGVLAEQSFSVDVVQERFNTPFVGDGAVVTITDGSANSASVIALPLSGGDGEICP